MLPVSILFIFFAGVAFLGFAINALFDKIRIAYVLPLMLIGLLVGPILNIINVGSTSIVQQLSPYITALAVAFILFDVGLNMRFSKLGKVVGKATKFTLVTQVITGFVIAATVYFAFDWNVLLSLVFGFGLSGPSAIMVPAIMKRAFLKQEIKTTLVYESVITDVLQLIVPLMLLGLMATVNPSLGYIGSTMFTSVFGAAVLGVLSALFWLYMLKRFMKYSVDYSWMLTVTMTIATYGIAEQLGISSSLAVFVFGLAFANIGLRRDGEKGSRILRSLAFPKNVLHIQRYQSEIVFFTSAFFFLYIGLLFNLENLDYPIVAMAIIISVLALLVRIITTPMLKSMMSKEPEDRKVETGMVQFSVSRGLAAAVIAAAPLTLGISIPGFLDVIFLVILITTVISTAGITLRYRGPKSVVGRKG